MNTIMNERTLIRDHMIRMIALFNDVEILGVEINRET